MRENVAVIGSGGNMGQRYMRILDTIPYVNAIPVEVDEWSKLDGVELGGAIIATPTNTHLKCISDLCAIDGLMPILCEKPIATSWELAEEAFSGAPHLRMLNQYKAAMELTELSQTPDTHTYYDYFRTGSDGLYWDCINIIGMADSTLSIGNSSPVWKCAINGQPLNLGDIDAGYLHEVADWIKYGEGNRDYALEAHQRVEWLLNA
jgi:hypothetical protein